MKKLKIFPILIVLAITSALDTKVVRNTALMEKIISDMQRKTHNDINYSNEEPIPSTPEAEDATISSKQIHNLQKVFCITFPNVPCGVIEHDPVLQNLILRSIKQIDKSRSNLRHKVGSTKPQNHMFRVNNEDISNFLRFKNNNYFTDDEKQIFSLKLPTSDTNKKEPYPAGRIKSLPMALKSQLSNENSEQNVKDTLGRKKIRKFYPHKVKYKDKLYNPESTHKMASDEKFSLSGELSDRIGTNHRQHVRYNVQESPDVWRIDHMKPSVREDTSRRSSDRAGRKLNPPNNINDRENKDVLESDVYINKFMKYHPYGKPIRSPNSWPTAVMN